MTITEEYVDDIKILNQFYEVIKENPQECVIELAKEFCFDNDIEIEHLGFLISGCKDLKDYTEKNLKKFKYIQTLKTTKIAD